MVCFRSPLADGILIKATGSLSACRQRMSTFDFWAASVILSSTVAERPGNRSQPGLVDPQPHDVVGLDKGADLKRDNAVEPAPIDLAGHRDALPADVYAGIVHPLGQQRGLVPRQVDGQPAVDRLRLEDLAPASFDLQVVVQRRDLPAA